jgi:cytochrome c oxidase subunit 3|tara:strand:+ start:346 stop:918 length:573 start_codon:yes stop_codon:yes gene_type:complete
MSNDINIKMSRAKKMMLWVGMISISMTFAGLTSAFIVSSKRADWLSDFIIPNDFLISTILIILSSLFFYLSKNKLKAEKINSSKIFLLVTFISAIFFVFFQFRGFNSIIDQGFYFTGAESSVTTSYLYVLVLLHLAHLFAGFISLVVVYYNLSFGKYTGGNNLGFELAHTFWHFLGFLWIYLFLFVKLYH